MFNSLRRKLLLAFSLVAILPVVMISIILFGRNIRFIERKTTELTETNLEKVSDNINLALEGYEDLLFQLYTDDAMIELVNGINEGENIALYTQQLIRRAHETTIIKPYIQSVMIIPKQGDAIFFDRLTAATTKSSWLNSYEKSQDEIYRMVSTSNQTIIFPTKYASTITGKDYYLFHMAHRLIDYKDIDKEIGIVIFSLDENMLNQICNGTNAKEQRTSINFLVDEDNEIISFPDNRYVGTKLSKLIDKEQDRIQIFEEFIGGTGVFGSKEMLINSFLDKTSGWTIVNVEDRNVLLSETRKQQKIMLFTLIGEFIVLSGLSVWITLHLTESIDKVVGVMISVSNGNLAARIELDGKMPEEIETIARQFNSTMEQLEEVIQKEKEATLKQKDAEIKFLEAQINPHFLYNTLDTINWMAIDKEQYEISNTINALANILRYSIEKNNKMVPVSSEIEWLKKYIFLQQYRIKSQIDCQIRVEPQVMKYHIHKLLMQPFVENAIIHGFDKSKTDFQLVIEIEEVESNLKIMIQDNGKGIPEQMIKEICSENMEEESHIGINNAIGRIQRYYGEASNVQVQSEIGQGTTIIIIIPKIEENETDENSNCRR